MNYGIMRSSINCTTSEITRHLIIVFQFAFFLAITIHCLRNMFTKNDNDEEKNENVVPKQPRLRCGYMNHVSKKRWQKNSTLSFNVCNVSYSPNILIKSKIIIAQYITDSVDFNYSPKTILSPYH